MDNFIQELTEDTPYISLDCDKNHLMIKGISYPEDTEEFYAPIFTWLEEYFSQLKDTDVTVDIEIIYFHSGSTKVLFYFFDKLAEEARKDTIITINWIYEKQEKDMREFGEQLQRDFKELKFSLVEKEPEDIHS